MARGTEAGAGRLGVGLAVGALLGLLSVDLDLPALVSFWRDRSFLVPLAALVAAPLWLTPLRRLLGALTVLAAALWLAVAFTPLVGWMADGLVRRDRVQAADAVFVFGSRLQSDGEPTNDSMSRLLKAVELVAGRQAKHLIVSELHPPSRRYTPLAREWVQRFGLDAEVIAVGPISRSRDEALAVARLCRERGWKRVLAVTSPVHTRRAAASLEKQGLVVVAVPSIETRYDVETLDHPSERLRAFGSVAHERVGLFVYGRRGWI